MKKTLTPEEIYVQSVDLANQYTALELGRLKDVIQHNETQLAYNKQLAKIIKKQLDLNTMKP